MVRIAGSKPAGIVTKRDKLDSLLAQIGGMEDKLAYYGAAEEPKPWYSGMTTGLEKILNVLGTPSRLSAGLASEMIEPSEDPMDVFVKTFTGERQIGYADVLGKLGVENKYAKGIGGFIGDVALDPTSYIGLGAAKSIIKKGAQEAGEKVFKDVTKKALEEVGEKGVTKSIDEAVKASDILTDIAKGAGIELPVSKAALKMTSSRRKIQELLGKQIKGLGESEEFLKALPHSSNEVIKESLYKVNESIMREASEKGGLKLKAFGMEKVLIPRTTMSKTYDNIFSTLRNIPGYDNLVGNPAVRAVERTIGKTKKWLGNAFIPEYDIKSLSDPEARNAFLNVFESFRNATESGEVHTMSKIEDMFGKYFERLGEKQAKLTTEAASAVRELPEDISEVALKAGKAADVKTAKAITDIIYSSRENLSSTLRDVVADAADDIPTSMRKNLLEVADLIDKVPEHDMWQMVDTMKRAFDDVVKEEGEYGLLHNVRENYITHMLTPKGYDYVAANKIKLFPFGKGGREWRVILPYGKEREIEGTITAINRRLRHEVNGNLFETEAHKVVAKRLLTSVKTIEKHKAIEKMKTIVDMKGKKFFQKIEEGLPTPSGWIEVPGIDELKGWVVDPEIASIVGRYKDIVINDDAMREFLGAYDRVLNMWKLGATALNPGFHGRNTLSGFWQGYLHNGTGYMNPYLHKQAKAILKGADGVLTTPRGTYTYKEIKEMLTNTATLWKGQLGVDIPRKFGEAIDDIVTPTKTILQKGKFGLRHAVRGARAIGTYVENEQRAADFILSLSKGLDPLEASRQVKHFFFDYSSLSPFERNVMRRAFPFYCVDEDTECLTNSGWKKYNKISGEDKLLTYNLKTKELEWQNHAGVNIFDYNGQLVHFSSNNIDLFCTPNHRCITEEKGIKEAIDVAEYANHCPMTGKNTNIDYPISDKVLSLIGWIISDGTFRRNYSEISIYQKKYNNVIENLLKDEEYSINIHPGTGVTQYRIIGETRRVLANWFKHGLWSIIPNLSKRQCNILRDTIILAEGSVVLRKNHIFIAQQGKYRDLFQLIWLLAGYNCKLGPKGFYERRVVSAKYLNKRVEWYSGKVWCPSTPNTTAVFRRNGTITISGNSWSRHNIPMELEQMVAQPGKFIGIQKVGKAASVMAGETEKERSLQDQWVKELYPIKVPEPFASGIHSMLGIDKNKVIYWNPNLPPQDLNRLNLSELITSLTPPAKVAMELYFNKNVFFGEEIEKYKGQKYKVPGYINVLRNFIPEDSPIFKSLGMEFRKREGENVMVMPAKQRYLLDQISPFMKNIGTAVETLPPGKEKARFLSWLIGIKFVPLDIKQETMERTLERQKELMDLIQLAKSRGQIPIGARQKKGPLGQIIYEGGE